MDRNQAYWFETQAVENFHGPLDITVSDPAGVDFGRLGSLITVSIRNRTTVAQTVTLTPSSSAAAPAGQEAFAGPVPLTRLFRCGDARLCRDAGRGSHPRQHRGRRERPGPDRSQPRVDVRHGQPLFASLLRVTDAANAMDVYLPVRARAAGTAGCGSAMPW